MRIKKLTLQPPASMQKLTTLSQNPRLRGIGHHCCCFELLPGNALYASILLLLLLHVYRIGRNARCVRYTNSRPSQAKPAKIPPVCVRTLCKQLSSTNAVSLSDRLKKGTAKCLFIKQALVFFYRPCHVDHHFVSWSDRVWSLV